MEGYQQVGPSTVPGWTFWLEIYPPPSWSEGTNNLCLPSIHDDTYWDKYLRNKYEYSIAVNWPSYLGLHLTVLPLLHVHDDLTYVQESICPEKQKIT